MMSTKLKIVALLLGLHAGCSLTFYGMKDVKDPVVAAGSPPCPAPQLPAIAGAPLKPGAKPTQQAALPTPAKL